MSYDPSEESSVELLSAWNSTNQTLPTYITTQTNLNFTLSLDTVGVGDSTIVSNVITPARAGMTAFYTGDSRSVSSASVLGDLYAMQFRNTSGDPAAGCQRQRANLCEDQFYSIYTDATVEIDDVFRISGNTIAPYVRVLGVMIEGG